MDLSQNIYWNEIGKGKTEWKGIKWNKTMILNEEKLNEMKLIEGKYDGFKCKWIK